MRRNLKYISIDMVYVNLHGTVYFHNWTVVQASAKKKKEESYLYQAVTG
jgi:hypothetical protein